MRLDILLPMWRRYEAGSRCFEAGWLAFSVVAAVWVCSQAWQADSTRIRVIGAVFTVLFVVEAMVHLVRLVKTRQR